MIREIRNEEELKTEIETVRGILIQNGAEDLLEYCTVEEVKKTVKRMNEGGTKWTYKDELQDLIYESWGYDN